MYHKHTQEECEKILSNSGFIRCYSVVAEKLKLRPIENTIFSIIYSYISQGQECYASLNQFAEWTATSKPTIIKAIKHLTQLQLIQVSNSIEYCGRPKNYYYINYDILGQYLTGETTPTRDSKETLQTGSTNQTTPPKKSYEVSKETLPTLLNFFTEDGKETLQRVSKETLPYNNSKIKKEDNKINNNSDNNVQSQSDWTSPPPKFFDLFGGFSDEEKQPKPTKKEKYEIDWIFDRYPNNCGSAYSDKDFRLRICHLMDEYGGKVADAVLNYADETKNIPKSMRMSIYTFFGIDNNGHYRFLDYAEKGKGNSVYYDGIL